MHMILLTTDSANTTTYGSTVFWGDGSYFLMGDDGACQHEELMEQECAGDTWLWCPLCDGYAWT